MRTNKYQPSNSVFRFGQKQAGFIDFLKPNYSEYSIYRTLGYVQSVLVTNIVKEIAGVDCIYDVKDLEHLDKIVKRVRKEDQNTRLHKVYSAAVHRYIRYFEQR